MPQLHRMYCSNCKRSVYNCVIDGVRVPLVFYFVVGQPDDTGPRLDVNGPGVKLPSFVRELMQPHVPVPRAELCMACVGEVFGVELVTADRDPVSAPAEVERAAESAKAVADDPDASAVDRHAVAVARALKAIRPQKARPMPKPPGKAGA